MSINPRGRQTINDLFCFVAVRQLFEQAGTISPPTSGNQAPIPPKAKPLKD
jgi:hypothetical protein